MSELPTRPGDLGIDKRYFPAIRSPDGDITDVAQRDGLRRRHKDVLAGSSERNVANALPNLVVVSGEPIDTGRLPPRPGQER